MVGIWSTEGLEAGGEEAPPFFGLGLPLLAARANARSSALRSLGSSWAAEGGQAGERDSISCTALYPPW